MPTFEFKCPDCEQYFDQFCKIAERSEVVHHGCVSMAKQVIRTNASLDWTRLAMGGGASPEAVNRFDRVHREQTAKEEKAIREHGSIN